MQSSAFRSIAGSGLGLRRRSINFRKEKDFGNENEDT